MFLIFREMELASSRLGKTFYISGGTFKAQKNKIYDTSPKKVTNKFS